MTVKATDKPMNIITKIINQINSTLMGHLDKMIVIQVVAASALIKTLLMLNYL